MPKQYMVELAQDERDELEAVLKSSTRRAVSATKLQRARILLAVDQGGAGPVLTDMQVVDALGVTERTCQHVRRRAVEQGPMKALERRPRPLPPVPKKLDGRRKRVWFRWPVRFHRKAAFGGPLSCWRKSWCGLKWSKRFAGRPCGRR